MTENIKKIEAILFAVGRAITEREISQLALISLDDVHHSLKELKKQYAERESPLLIIEEGDAWKLTVHEKYMQTVQGINPHTELGKSILETLAVIAWKQPATQSEVIKIRTNKAYEHISELERLGFVSKEKHGRTYYVKVTGKFFDYFDLPKDKGVKEIFKDIKDVEEVVQTKFSEQEGNVGLETYGLKPEVELEKEGKKHIDGLETFEDVPSESKPLLFEEDKPKETNPVAEFIKENKKLSPQEEELLKEEKKIKELVAEEEDAEGKTEEGSEETKEDERELDPELEGMIQDKKKEKK